MNTNYYNNPSFPSEGNFGPVTMNPQTGITQNSMQPKNNQSINTGTNMFPIEQSYIENILRLNRGKLATFYMSFPDSVEWRDKVFTGIIEAAGRDHIIISDPKTGQWYLLLMIYLNYVDFDEKINYSPEYYPGTNS